MSTDRRTWIKQSSLALAGLTMFNEKIFSAPAHSFNDLPPGSIIKLSSNENPYGPSPLARKAMSETVAQSNRYPWESINPLIDKIALRLGLKNENILLGAGSAEILGLVTQLVALQKGNAISADPTFRIWWSAAEKSGLQIIKIPLTKEKQHDLPAMLSKITSETRMIYICNPNNPVGNVIATDELKSFINEASKKTMVLLDEAYTEYSDEPTLAGMVTDNKNLVVAKTFSKIFGMAGARIGYAIAHPDSIEQLASIQPWPNAAVSSVSVAGALASLGDKDFINLCKSKNTAAKEWVYSVFKELNIAYIPSHTNFLYYSAKDYKGDLNDELSKNNIRATRIMEEDGKWTRITIGTIEEMKTYTNVIRQLWKNS